MFNPESVRNAAELLALAVASRPRPRIFAGPDGFVDEIIQVVDTRYDATRYDPIRTITDYAARLAGAAGKSTNVEFVVREVKSGGNGPLMSEAFGRLGGYVKYVGAVGWPLLDPIFAHLKEYGEVVPVAPAAQTLAAEFEDGKIMHGKHQSLKDITWDNLTARMGGLDALDASLRDADLVALINWTMLPYLTDVFEGVLTRLPELGGDVPRFFFFDLCDPEKRTREDLVRALDVIGAFAAHAPNVVLGLNEKESLSVCSALDLPTGADDAAALIDRARRIAGAMGATEVVIHPTRLAAAWSRAEGEGSTPGPYCAAPRLTTGAGDHFNGGYMFARLLGLSPANATIIGKCVSGFYVREGRGPSAPEIVAFAARWAGGTLDPWLGPIPARGD